MFKYFKIDALTALFSKLIYLASNLLFWNFLMVKGYIIEGWSYGDIVVFIAFSELFYGINGAIFSISSRFWRTIHDGAIDNYLTRPLDARLRFIVLNIDYITLVSSVIEFVVLLLMSGVKMSISSIALGALAVFIANLCLAQIGFTCSYTSFWLGRIDAITEILDSLTTFNKYPLNIMPNVLVVLFKFIFPFYFFSTFSAEIVNGFLGAREYLIAACGLVLNIIIWFTLSEILWKKGLERYDSVNG